MTRSSSRTEVFVPETSEGVPGPLSYSPIKAAVKVREPSAVKVQDPGGNKVQDQAAVKAQVNRWQ